MGLPWHINDVMEVSVFIKAVRQRKWALDLMLALCRTHGACAFAFSCWSQEVSNILNILSTTKTHSFTLTSHTCSSVMHYYVNFQMFWLVLFRPVCTIRNTSFYVSCSNSVYLVTCSYFSAKLFRPLQCILFKINVSW